MLDSSLCDHATKKIHVLVLGLGIMYQKYDLGAPSSISLMVLATRIMFLDS